MFENEDVRPSFDVQLAESPNTAHIVNVKGSDNEKNNIHGPLAKRKKTAQA